MTARTWLAENRYDDVLELITRVEKIWKTRGVSTRRNWWEVLAGDKDGNPRIVEGFEFPVLMAAQEHEGKRITKNAVRRSPREAPPDKDFRGKWSRTPAPKKHSRRTSAA